MIYIMNHNNIPLEHVIDAEYTNLYPMFILELFNKHPIILNLQSMLCIVH